MSHATDTASYGEVIRGPRDGDAADDELQRGSEWDSEAVEREWIDARDAENLDLDAECINARLERRSPS